ncbi:MAG: prepilin-type N-terminal cleavage/methylation domain-containing protein [Candidatus Hydrogenedentes bacterium]|nr:prepilin-type N-terminal cleavage/methylation domain-containing protein [Candidatus Hydrogenedentota bacterium]
MRNDAVAMLQKRSGFTLIEVLIALTILAGGLFVLVNTHYSALNLHLITEEEVDNRSLLESILGRAELGIAAGELSGGGDFGSRYPGYSWSYEAEQVGEEGGSPLLSDTLFYRVTATLMKSGGESKSLEFFSFSNSEMETIQQRP